MKIDLSALIGTIESGLSEYSWFFSHLKNHNGALHLPEPFVSFLSSTYKPHWATYYENPAFTFLLPLATILGSDRFQQLMNELSDLTPEQVTARVVQLQNEIMNNPDSYGSDMELITSIEPDQFLPHLSSLTPDKRTELESKAYYFFSAFVVSTFQFLAVISTGKNMCQLVQLAKDGDDVAYCKAAQVDRTVIFAIPYFRERLSRAQLSGDTSFLKRLARSFSGKVMGSQIKYPELWLVFSILHDHGYLETLSNDELLDICEQLSVYASFDINALAKRKNEFLKKQGRES